MLDSSFQTFFIFNKVWHNCNRGSRRSGQFNTNMKNNFQTVSLVIVINKWALKRSTKLEFSWSPVFPNKGSNGAYVIEWGEGVWNCVRGQRRACLETRAVCASNFQKIPMGVVRYKISFPIIISKLNQCSIDLSSKREFKLRHFILMFFISVIFVLLHVLCEFLNPKFTCYL